MLPVLYSFRRCPYALRARLALHSSGTAVELREVSLRDKPESMLAASPKGSVPVLILQEGQVIDESWDIMHWALQRNDPESWLGPDHRHVDDAVQLVSENDTEFKYWLDRYKYPDRYPEQPQTRYRNMAGQFLLKLETRLNASRFLLGDERSVADVALFPFIRQFAGVDKDWFVQSPCPKLQRWLKDFLDSAGFAAVMAKYEIWHPGDPPVIMSPGLNFRE
jgi:glutathione S-transferase